MPTNKNALLRYKYLDRLLSDHHHFYDIHDLTEKVNEMLCVEGLREVTKRCIEKDLVEMEGLFSAPIERFSKNGKRCISYGKYSFSIFTQAMSREEIGLLREVLSTIGQFDGLDNFHWLEDFKIGLGLEERKQIHKMVCNIVHLPRMQQICDELYTLMKKRKVLCTINPEAMLSELRRLGMPSDIKGFSDQNFYHYFRAPKPE